MSKRDAEMKAVVPDGIKYEMQALPTGPHDPALYPIIDLVNYLRKRSRMKTNMGWRTESLVRGNFSMFRNVDDSWAAQAINISALHEASFNQEAFEAANPGEKERVDTAVAAILAYKNRPK